MTSEKSPGQTRGRINCTNGKCYIKKIKIKRGRNLKTKYLYVYDASSVIIFDSDKFVCPIFPSLCDKVFVAVDRQSVWRQ